MATVIKTYPTMFSMNEHVVKISDSNGDCKFVSVNVTPQDYNTLRSSKTEKVKTCEEESLQIGTT